MSRPRGAVAWALYDLGNTVYSLLVVSLFFVQWVTVDRGREDLWFSLAYGSSMLVVALLAPYLGLWSDRSGGRLRFLAAFTVLCLVATAGLAGATRVPGTGGLLLALAVFALSNIGFQGGLVFYNALLPAVSDPSERGRVSGLGVALGYLGSLLGILLVVPFVEGTVPGLGWRVMEPGGRTAAFLPSALLFAVFAVPLFLRVQDVPGSGGPRPGPGEAWRDLLATVRDTRRYPGLGRFLLGNFLVLDAIHSAILFMAVFAEKVVGLPDSSKAGLFLVATLPAMGGSFLAGRLSDRHGPRRVFLTTVALWVVCPVIIALVPREPVLYAVGGVIGALLGSLWTTTRPFLLGLVPPGEQGRAFGLYAFCNRSAAVLGPQVWGLTVLLAAPLGPDRYRLAIVLLAGIAALGWLVLRRVPEPVRPVVVRAPGA